MNFSGFLCYNCQGQGHRSSKCPFAAAHRRCPTCGKAGADYVHRDGCADSWYDLSVRVPRYDTDKRTVLTKKQVDDILLESYTSERCRHQARVEGIELRERSNMTPARLDDSDQNLRTEYQIDNATCQAAVQIKDSQSIVAAENMAENATFRDEVGLTLLLRFVFVKRPTAYIDFGNGHDIEMRETLFRMQNGLNIKYAAGRLDFYGRANEIATFMITAFRLKIERDVVVINGTHIFSEIGMTIRAGFTALAGVEPTKYSITMVGRSEDEIRVRYKASRYIMKLEGDGLQINAFEPNRRLH